jgi:hypothetical protein
MKNIYIDAEILTFPEEPEAEGELHDNLEAQNIKNFLYAIEILGECIRKPWTKPECSIFIRTGLNDILTDLERLYDYNCADRYSWRFRNRITNVRPRLTREPRDIFRLYFNHGTFFDGKKTIPFDPPPNPEINIRSLNDLRKELYTYVENIRNLPFHQNTFICSRQNENNEIERRVSWIDRELPIRPALRGYADVQGLRFPTLNDAFLSAKKEFGKEIYFSEDIQENPNSLLHNTEKLYDQSGVPDRLFFYLNTLHNVVTYIRQSGNDTQKYEERETLNALVQTFGCNSAPEYNGYDECLIRRWSIGAQQKPFSLHLRPITRNERDDTINLTMRIYYKWNEQRKQIVIGMICKHLPCHGGHVLCAKCRRQMRQRNR